MCIFKRAVQWRSLLLMVLSLLLTLSVAWADSESKNRQFTTDFD